MYQNYSPLLKKIIGIISQAKEKCKFVFDIKD